MRALAAGFHAGLVLAGIRESAGQAAPKVILMLGHGAEQPTDLFGLSVVVCMMHTPVAASRLSDALTEVFSGQSARRHLPTGGIRLDQVQFKGRRVLLAQDNPINQAVALDLLAEMGLAADLAQDDENAVNMSKAASYDLLLMDKQKRRKDALDAAREFRRLPERQQVPILAMTAMCLTTITRPACRSACMTIWPSRLTLTRWPTRCCAGCHRLQFQGRFQ